MNGDDNKSPKNQWFAPRTNGRGISPRSWQGWLIVALAVGAEISTITIAHDSRPSWFVAKTVGYGFNPATWQGWLATIGPVAVFILLIAAIYFRQRQPA